MFRDEACPNPGVRGFPRVCGDVPSSVTSPQTGSTFSPRMRGCSGLWLITLQLQPVFPAYAGMFRDKNDTKICGCGFPRVCGDVPAKKLADAAWDFVFPAYAGMFRPYHGAGAGVARFPRVCGDVPANSAYQ